MSGTDAMKVRECLSHLEQTERYVVLLYFADGLTLAEISAVLDVSFNHISDTLSAFRQTVAKQIDPCEKQRDVRQFVDNWLASTQSVAS